MKKLLFLLFVAISFVLISSCSDEDPVSPQEEHYEAYGLEIQTSGIKIASIFKGVTKDTLIVPEGALTDHWKVKFFSEDSTFLDDPDESKYSLGWEIQNSSIVGVYQHEGEEGGFELHLEGLSEGETKIEFFIKHQEHNDFRSGQLPVRVEHQEGTHGKPIGVKIVDEETGDTLFTYNESTGNTTGGLSVASGSTTDHLLARFFDVNNVVYQPGYPTHELVINSDNENIVQITEIVSEEFAFKLKGFASGTATIDIIIMHDGAVGKEFNNISVSVQ